MLYLDLDLFKDVNDTLGHPVGDALLKVVADRLRDCVRGIDSVARLGGDEFAVLQASIEQPSDAVSLATRLGQALRAPFLLDCPEVHAFHALNHVVPGDGRLIDRVIRQ